MSESLVNTTTLGKGPKKAKRTAGEEKVTLEDELAMLQKFLDSYNLQHPTIVTPADSTMNKEYAVTSIPHVALLDKSGAVRLIKIRSVKECQGYRRDDSDTSI